MTRTFALFTLLTLAGCASDLSVGVVHAVPPKFNIVPAKSVAVIGGADNEADQKHEDNFIDLVVYTLRLAKQYDVKDERQLARAINPGHGLFEAADWQKYLDETAGEVIVRVGVPSESSQVSGSDDDGWDVECFARLDLFRPRTGERIGSVRAHGTGYDADQLTAWADALNDTADQIIGGFASRKTYDLIELDHDAPLVREGMRKFDNSEYAAVLSLWEDGLTKFPNSAPLLYNLGAVCEALSDEKAARVYYSRAIAIAPQVQHYQQALAQLNQRRADAEAAVADPGAEDARKMGRHR